MTDIQVFDANMDPVAGFSISSGSGTSYGADGIVPEPSSLLTALVGMGTLVLSLLAQRRRNCLGQHNTAILVAADYRT